MQWVRAYSLRKRKVECKNPGSDRPKSLEQVVTAPLPNGDDHYNRLARVTVDVAR